MVPFVLDTVSEASCVAFCEVLPAIGRRACPMLSRKCWLVRSRMITAMRKQAEIVSKHAKGTLDLCRRRVASEADVCSFDGSGGGADVGGDELGMVIVGYK